MGADTIAQRSSAPPPTADRAVTGLVVRTEPTGIAVGAGDAEIAASLGAAQAKVVTHGVYSCRHAAITPTRKGNTMTVTRGLLALLEAKPGKGAELAAFLEQGRALAAEETGTVTWYAFKLSDTTYGVFDTFNDEHGRQAHLNGQIPAALDTVGPELLAEKPNIHTIDIVAAK